MQNPILRIARNVVVAAAVVAVFLTFRAPLGRAALASLVDVLSGTRLSFTSLELQGEQATFADVHLTRGADPLFDARHVIVTYSLHDLVFGGAHRYGLVAVGLDAPRLWLVRHADGSFNIGGNAAGGGTVEAGKAATPLAFEATLHQGSIVVLDPNRVLPDARRLTIADLEATATIDSAASTRVTARGDFQTDATQRFTAGVRADADGYLLARLRAGRIELAPVLDYFVNTNSARFLRAEARDLDLEAYAFGPPANGSPPYHFIGGTYVSDAAMRVPGIVPSVTHMHGRVDLFDGGVAAPRLDAHFGVADVVAEGALYDWSEPKFRLAISAPALPLERARELFHFSTHVPISGTARVATLLEGGAGSPLVASSVEVPQLLYGRYPASAVRADVIYNGGAVDVVGLHGVYGGLNVAANGRIETGDVARSQVVVAVDGPAARVPYAAQAAPAALLHAAVLLEGEDLRLDGRGTIVGAGGGTCVAGVFHVDRNGDGAFGPIAIERSDGTSLAGAFTLRRSASESAFWFDAKDFALVRNAAAPHLPGVSLAPPDFSGRLDGALAGSGPPSRFVLGGRARVRDLVADGVAIGDVQAIVSGTYDNVRLEGLEANGALGAFRGRGAYDGARLALEGTYRGSFEALRSLTGDLGARGSLDGPLAILLDSHGAIVQARGDGARGATVRGVPVDGLSGTLAIAGRNVRVYAATARVAGGNFAAAGTLAPAHAVGVSVASAEGTRLQSLAPLQGGQVAAIGTFDTDTGVARFRGGISLGAGRAGGVLGNGNGDVTLAGSSLAVRAGDADVAGAVGSLEGSIAGLGNAAPRYDLDLHLTAARLNAFAAAVVPDVHGLAGTLEGDLRLRGAGQDLALRANVAVPEGVVNGLSFAAASGQLQIARGAVAFESGRVTVGSTRVRFGANVDGADAGFAIESPRADLADFDDLFDNGDALAGRGRINGHFVRANGRIRTYADIAIAGLHYQRFDFGDANAHWTSRGQNVAGRIAFGGAAGQLVTAGNVVLAARGSPADVLTHSVYRGTANLQGLDLGVWLPAAGISLPLTGRVDAAATVSGPIGNPLVDTNATLTAGTFSGFPVDRLEVAATSTARRTTVTRAELQGPSLQVSAAGTFGLRGSDPVALALHATSPNIGPLAGRLFGAAYPVTGAGTADLTLSGTRARPRLGGAFDVTDGSLRGVAVRSVRGTVSVTGHAVVLSGVDVGFASGTLTADGSLPFELAPLRIGPADAPIALALEARDVDLADFASLLPPESELGGGLAGRVTIGGTPGSPKLDGALALSRGVFRAPFETVPLTGIAANLSFADKEARLENLQATAGGGTLAAEGWVRFADLVQPSRDAAYRFDAVASRLHLDMPAFGSGSVDGEVTVARAEKGAPTLAGAITLDDAAIPFSALLAAGGNASAASPGAGFGGSTIFGPGLAPPAPPGAAFDLTLTADRNVRIRSGNVDIGARGSLHVGGSRESPVLAGVFHSTGGTIAYFNTVFRLIDAEVRFDPALGVVPVLDAHATAHVINPDPNVVRNPGGSADISLDLRGPVTNLSIELSSDPQYDRQQILGLLLNAPALGASDLFGDTAQNPTLYGSNETHDLPATFATRNASGELSVAQEAFGVANAQFTRTLLAPIETSFAQAVGLSNVNLNVDYTGNVGFTARKILGHNVNAIYGTTFGYPSRQTFGFEVKPNQTTAAQVTVFETVGAVGLNSLTPIDATATNQRLQASQPTAGTAGFSLSLQRLLP